MESVNVKFDITVSKSSRFKGDFKIVEAFTPFSGGGNIPAFNLSHPSLFVDPLPLTNSGTPRLCLTIDDPDESLMYLL